MDNSQKELNLANAVGGIISERLRERTEGLRDLKLILGRLKNEVNQAIDDKGFHAIFEALDRAVRRDKPQYAKAKSLYVENQMESRLSSYASAFRAAVTAKVSSCKPKMVRALLSHVMEMLPVAGGGLCQPLSLDYVKSMVIVLEFQPHTEHLPSPLWNTLVEFCTGYTNYFRESDGQDPDQSAPLSLSPTRGDTQGESARPRNHHGPTSSRILPKDICGPVLEQLLLSLQYLVQPANAPVLEKAEKIFSTVLHFITPSKTPSRQQQLALGVFNSVFRVVSLNYTSLCQVAVNQILPALRSWWLAAKSLPAREQLLVTLIQSFTYLEAALVGDGDDTDTTRSSLEELIETIQDDYAKRSEREVLQPEDLWLTSPKGQPTICLPLQAFTIIPRNEMPRVEQSWAIPQVAAVLMTLCEKKSTNYANAEQDVDDGSSASKRRCIRTYLEDLLLQAQQGSKSSSQTCAMQTMFFYLSQKLLTQENLKKVMNSLTLLVPDKNGTISSWAMLCLAGCAFQTSTSNVQLIDDWMNIWNVAARAAAVSSTCRAACYLMEAVLAFNLLGFDLIAESVDSMVSSPDVHAPAIVVDSSLSFWTFIWNSRRVKVPTASYLTSERTLHWLFSRWSPARLTDRDYVARYSFHAQPKLLVDLLLTCTGHERIKSSHSPLISSGNVAQAWSRSKNHEELMRYLLLHIEANERNLQEVADGASEVQFENEKSSGYSHLETQIINFCTVEFDAALESWRTQIAERLLFINTDMIRMLVSLCIVGASLTDTYHSQENRITRLLESTKALHDALATFLSGSVCQQDHIDVVLQAISPFLPDPILLNELSSGKGRNHLIIRLAESIQCRDDLQGSSNGYVTEPLDFDSEFDSQRSRKRTENAEAGLPRLEQAAEASLESFRFSTAAHLHLVAHMCQVRHNTTDEIASPHPAVKYLCALPTHELVACRRFIRVITASSTILNRADANTLLNHLGEEILSKYEHERCEVSLGICLDVMGGLVDDWSQDISDELAKTSADLYRWFITIALNNDIPSSNVRIQLANMLQRLLQVRPDYGECQSLPSVWTSLLKALQGGDLFVKSHIAEHLPKTFGLFILTKHEALFDEVLSKLPSDTDWKAGIAVRLRVLALLASAWYTVRRKGVYHIFEAPGFVPEATSHATCCLSTVSRSLNLCSSRELLKLYLPQILYTWLKSQSLFSIPFSIFGYTNLKEFLTNVRHEAVSQLCMRGEDGQVATLAEVIGSTWEEAILESFGRVAAYNIARDISLPPMNDSPHHSSGEARIRQRLGKDKFFWAINRNVPEILSIFFQRLEEVELIERTFTKCTEFDNAARSLKRMNIYSASKSDLPANQQPSFRAKYLIAEIEYLCRRTGRLYTNLWTPSLYLFVLRSLLDLVHPALGSLHACSILRKIRLLVCLAGEAALQDYPLERLLHSLGPFLKDARCTDDALGILQYLLETGRTYLTKVPSFTAGVSLSILASLRVFIDSPHDNTTQDALLENTKSNSQLFHTWFSNYLTSYTSASITGASEAAFKTIMHHACNIHGQGSAVRGTSEGHLLKALYDDESSGQKLLSRSAQALIFSLLCKNFSHVPSFREDIFGDDTTSQVYASHVWEVCHSFDVGRNYLVWAGRVLGRAFAASGCIPSQILRESEFKHVRDLALTSSTQTSGSKPALLKLLVDLMLSNDQIQISVAEKTLQRIILRLTDPQEQSDFEKSLPSSIIAALNWEDWEAPHQESIPSEQLSMRQAGIVSSSQSAEDWIRGLCMAITYTAKKDAVLGALTHVLSQVVSFARHAFPYLLHIVLLQNQEQNPDIRIEISDILKAQFHARTHLDIQRVRIILTALLYIRTQPIARERTRADREQWLDIDFQEVAKAAADCGMFKTGLLMVEVGFSEASRASRRSSAVKLIEPTKLLLEIYRNIDEPDSFYGVQQPASLETVMERLDYERDGLKNLSFRGAHYDSHLRLADFDGQSNFIGLVKALDHLDLSGLTLSAINTPQIGKSATANIENMYRSARRLGRWDLPVPEGYNGSETTIYGALQTLKNSSNRHAFRERLDVAFLRTVSQIVNEGHSGGSIQSSWRALAVLTEADEIMASEHPRSLREAWERMNSRDAWMHFGRVEDVSQIMSAREDIFSVISTQSSLQDLLHSTAQEARAIEIDVVLESSSLSRSHGALQSSLKAAMYLSGLAVSCKVDGLNLDTISRFETANVLWDQGEMAASIGVLQGLRRDIDRRVVAAPIGPAELLAKLGYQISEARLEKPDEIISQYLVPAVKELRGISQGSAAGQVFHEFATFCDRQLQDVENLEDFRRIERLRRRKETEVRELEKLLSSSSAQQKSNLQAHRSRAKQWFDLDDREYQRIHQSRESFLKQSLENYLLSLKACDKFDTDSLRFCALWLEHSGLNIANRAVAKHVPFVASRKFASLMNQLSSRLLNVEDDFQALLFALLLRICSEHPYHGMHQIFSISKSKGKDEAALSRHAAAVKLASTLKNSSTTSSRWLTVHNTNVCYARLALEKLDEKYKPGSRIPLRKSEAARRLEQEVPTSRVPPPTMKVALRADCDYSNLPIIAKFHSEMSVAGGVSAPKIITAVGSDGAKYKQLVKGGNDDLRQDAIMEQVFEHVSDLLQQHRATRQRNLGIRTYKVLPLTTNAGVIEFVLNTVPLHDYSLPAHQRHFPKDWKPNVCRKAIGDVQTQSLEVRLRAYRQVTEHFHPVLRYFFLERFNDPDEWFAKRLAYSRSTAAISILGHILGLGDRHGHNILLDEVTGEVVHIDLGVAFEQGRVLPVPEVVPFRLTRDIVDAMGITKAEGVFRRCCEFTLEALRKEAYTIQTVLDVLRYDPLYSWTMSPLRVKKMQEQSIVPQPTGDAAAGTSSKSRESSEPNEADRALTVVAKKLSKTLSVTATVNELIQQSTDERNLSLLYCGWAAYA